MSKDNKKLEENSPYEIIIKRFVILIGLLGLAPFMFSFSIKHLNKEHSIASYILIGISTLLIIFTVYFGIMTMKRFLNVLFEDEK